MTASYTAAVAILVSTDEHRKCISNKKVLHTCTVVLYAYTATLFLLHKYFVYFEYLRHLEDT